MEVEARHRAARSLPGLALPGDQHDRAGRTARRGARRRCRSRPRASPRPRRRSPAAAPLGRPRVDHRDSLAQDPLLDRLRSRLSVSSSLARMSASRVVVREHEVEADVGPSQPAGSVEPRREAECRPRSRRRSRHRRRRRASARAARVLGAARPRRPVVASARFSSTSGTTSAIVARATRSACRAIAGDRGRGAPAPSLATTPVPQSRERVVGRPRGDDRALRQLAAGPVVVGDDHVDAEPARRPRPLLDGGDAAVHREDQLHALLGEPLDRDDPDAVAFLEPAPQMPRHVGPDLAQRQPPRVPSSRCRRRRSRRARRSARPRSAAVRRRSTASPPCHPRGHRCTTRSSSVTWRRPSSACALPRSAAERICVHGDYDVDGICSTALAVLTLRESGADVTASLEPVWEGYGVAAAPIACWPTTARVDPSVDCGITAAHRGGPTRGELGIDPIVLDHHLPGDEPPDCPIVATRPVGLPCPYLPAAPAWSHMLVQALLGPDHPATRPARRPGRPRHGRRRRPARRREPHPAARASGLARPRTRARGAHARRRLEAATVGAPRGFRLAPRINAAGRLDHPRRGLQLLLTDDDREADSLADELEDAERRRQEVEERILREAVAAVEAGPARAHRGYVVRRRRVARGRGGYRRLRLVERSRAAGRPVAGDGEAWKGWGRSIAELPPPRRPCRLFGPSLRFGGHRRCWASLLGPTSWSRSPPPLPPTPTERLLVDQDLSPRDPNRRHRSGRRAHARSRPRASSSWRRSASATPM